MLAFQQKRLIRGANFIQFPLGFAINGGYNDSLQDYVQLLRQGIDGNQDFYKTAWRSEAKNYLQATRFLTGKYAKTSNTIIN